MDRIAYTDGGLSLSGVLARPAGQAKGAVVVFPTITNQTENVERRLPMLADAGYVAFLADFYGKTPADRAQSMQMGAELRQDVSVYRSRISAAIKALADHPASAGLPMAAIGYCLGGQSVLEAARMGADLKAVVSFHGLLMTGAPAADPIAGRILVCHGDLDPLVPRNQVRGFQEEMDAVGANYHLHIYAGVKHGFTDSASDSHGMPALGYDSYADGESWASMLRLFDDVFA